VGVQRPAFEVAEVVTLSGPPGYDLDRVARSHAGAGLRPHAYDGRRLTTVLPSGTLARVDRALRVELSAPDPVGLQVLRRVLDLDTDLTELWALADPWMRATGAGRQLRAGSVLEALAQALAGTNTSYRGTQAMMEQLVGDGPFPLPGQVPGRPLTAWGYRAPALLGAGRAVDEGLDEGWPDASDEEVLSAVRRLPGFGPFAAASVLPLLGRPRPLVLDRWLAQQVPDPGRYARYGRWGGTVLWLDVTRTWFPAV
jgi:hypothetical protein